jgi:orotate phosphoribosyltransferase
LEIAKRLYQQGAIAFGSFTLNSGIKSPVYLDLRVLPSYPDVFRELVELSLKRLHELNFDTLAGVATGGLPWASVISYALSKPLVYVREESKEHGRRSLVEGALKGGESVLVVDDVATTGSSLAKAVDVLRSARCVVNYAFVIVDREQGALELLRSKRVQLLRLFTLKEILSSLCTQENPRDVQLKAKEALTWLKTEPLGVKEM